MLEASDDAVMAKTTTSAVRDAVTIIETSDETTP
jgi:hypothetical protein